MLAEVILTAVAHTVASIVSMRRELVRFTLTDDECETAGLPYESAERAITVTESGPWWHCRVYLSHQPGPEGCIDIRALRMRAEVFYLRKATTSYRTAL